jgi:hypothetical protein
MNVKNAVSTAAVSTKTFVAKHKVPIAVVATATATVVVMDRLRGGALRDLHEFLDERGLENDFTTWVFEKAGDPLNV